MADISKITLPSGVTYIIKDEEARSQTLIATYTGGTTKNLALTFAPAGSVENEEYQRGLLWAMV